MIYGRVYLAGPITGLGYTSATDWREEARRRLTDAGIAVYSPMRWKSYLSGEGRIAASYEQIPLSSSRGLTTRDRFDVGKIADVVIANLLGAAKVSIGTCIELGWADAFRVPVILIMEPSGNPHEHPMVSELVGYRVGDLDSAIDLAMAMLVP